ncbi:MAG: type II toxin-antitoxin system HicB family antitoxin [Parcubacteria group bacterium]|nr:type II toxin-antitoxin system HicB family antitoxin [Parcubacteria group bacterium]
MNMKDVKHYKKLLPSRIIVKIHKTKEGFWAKIKEFPGCYTQADSFFELIEMVNDAVFTYLDIPQKLRSKLGYYTPELFQKIVDEVKRKHWEKAVQEIIKKEQFKKEQEVFRLKPRVCA